MNCEKCNKKHAGLYGSGRFCSSECAHLRIITDELKKRISVKLIKNDFIVLKCEYCNKEFKTKNKKRRFCCASCSSIVTAEITKEQKRIWAKRSAIKRYAESDSSIGWQKRFKSSMSYPEKYFAQVFKDFNYEYDFKVGRYFIDFAFIDKMIAIEIDGRRHNDPDIKCKDAVRTNFLESKGWQVFRIKWINPINELDKNRLKYQIDNVMKVLI